MGYGLNCVRTPHPSKKDVLQSWPPGPQNVTLSGDKDLTEVTKLNGDHSSGPQNHLTGVPVEEGIWARDLGHRRASCEEEGRGEGDVSRSQSAPKTAGHQNQEGAGAASLPRPPHPCPRGHQPCRHHNLGPSLALQPPEAQDRPLLGLDAQAVAAGPG